MKARLKDKYRAIELRKKGFTYKDIMKEIPVSKSLLSGWFRFLELSPEEEKELEKRAQENRDNGNSRAAISNRRKRIEREKIALEEAKKIFQNFKNEPNFVLGIGLYWAEGSKRSSGVQFMNSDPQMIRFMIFWLKKYMNIPEKEIFLRIYTHEDFKLEKYEEFWENEIKFPRTQFKKTIYKSNQRHGVFKKNPFYKGCARIEIAKSMPLFRQITSLIKILENQSNDAILNSMRPSFNG